MIALSGVAPRAQLRAPLQRRVWTVCVSPGVGPRHARALLVDEPGEMLEGFDLYLGRVAGLGVRPDAPFVELPAQLTYLAPGDIVSVSADGRRIRVLWRRDSYQNSILLTERCNHYCLMCSQPPKEVDDHWLLDDAVELVRLLPPNTTDIGFTGGEPTLYGAKLIQLLRLCRSLLPWAEVHVLSNGRRFADEEYARAWAGIENPRLMVGIPLYGPEPSLHDYVVQSKGAFEGTVRGILNLGELNQRIEIRVVMHKLTAPAIVEIAEFICRNLPFVEQVAIMGLEMIGLARAFADEVWIDPYEYRDALADALILLDGRGIRTMLYNHQLCLIDRDIWRFSVHSISDWKNEYHPECLRCSVIDKCGGFFFSARYRLSEHIRAIPSEESGVKRSLLVLNSADG
jgi:His-Xaa-Ser system radical SAM maturase HxsC